LNKSKWFFCNKTRLLNLGKIFLLRYKTGLWG
jgi:hypothetical protein